MKKSNTEKKKGGKLKWIIIIVLAIIIISAVAGGSDDENNDTADQTTTEATTEPKADDNVPTEYKSALSKAKTYSDTMHMSKQGIYNQLTSEYGEKFTAEQADYAVKNLK